MDGIIGFLDFLAKIFPGLEVTLLLPPRAAVPPGQLESKSLHC